MHEVKQTQLDLCQAMTEVQVVKETLLEIRGAADERFKSVYESAVQLGDKSGTEPSIFPECAQSKPFDQACQPRSLSCTTEVQFLFRY